MNNLLAQLANPTTIMIVAAALEALLHIIPSEKPLGIAHSAEFIIKEIAQVAGAVADFLDKVIPQNKS